MARGASRIAFRGTINLHVGPDAFVRAAMHPCADECVRPYVRKRSLTAERSQEIGL